MVCNDPIAFVCYDPTGRFKQEWGKAAEIVFWHKLSEPWTADIKFTYTSFARFGIITPAGDKGNKNKV